ncbi:MAG: flagellar hook assembly protein FlgD [Pseudomonadota bacterium]
MVIDSTGTYYSQSTVAAGDSASSTQAKKEMGKEDFLNLLVTQLKFQDPLNPMDSQQFSAQLAQFSSLEQLTNMNTTLGEIHNSMPTGENNNIIDYIGKTVKTNNSKIAISDGTVGSSVYYLDDKADVSISILNSAGVEVRNIKEGLKDSGEYTISWDGLDNKGKKLDDGIYSIEIRAINESGADVSAYAYFSGEVTGVTNGNKTPYLMVGGCLVSPEDVIEITKTNV